MAMQQLSLEAKRRVSEAKSARFDWAEVASVPLRKVVKANANAIGSPMEFVFVPMLTVVASFMGINAAVQINQDWSEPGILWTVVAARKGEKKTAARKRLLTAVEEIEEEVGMDFEPNDVKRPQLVVQHFSMEALHRVMMCNGCQMLGLYDEMSIMYGQLDVYKRSGSTLDRSTLLDLYNGGSWARNFKNQSGPSKMSKTAFNMSGYIQPTCMISMLEKSDTDGFNDRQLFDCPPEADFKYNDLKPMDAAIPPLSLIFKLIRTAHANKVTYTMCDEAKEKFIEYYDTLVERRKAESDDDNRRGVLSKAQGQCARLSMILHVLNQAAESAFELHCDGMYSVADIERKYSSWSSAICIEAVQFAITLTNHFIRQKFILLPKPADPPLHVEMNEQLSSHEKSFSRFLMYRHSSFTASEASRKRLIPPLPVQDRRTKSAAYPVEWAKKFMQKVADEGFGTVERVRSGNKSSMTFRKRKYDELQPKQLEILKRFKIPRFSYEPEGNHVGEASSNTHS